MIATSSMRREPVAWEARRFELIKETLKGILSDPDVNITSDELARTCIEVADKIIEKLKAKEL